MAKPEINKQKILWIDMEMSGLDPQNDVILELAAIVTDWQLEEQANLELVVKQDEQLLRDKFKTPFWQENAEAAQGLLEQNQHGISLAEFEHELIEFTQKQFEIDRPKADIVLAGNTIRADRAFLEQHLPEFTKYLHYRMLDVSAFKVWFEAKYQRIFPKPEAHRALEDIRGSIAELKYFDKYIKE